MSTMGLKINKIPVYALGKKGPVAYVEEYIKESTEKPVKCDYCGRTMTDEKECPGCGAAR